MNPPQQPDWPDPDEISLVRERLATMPALVRAEEAATLRTALREVRARRAVVLQAGDCAEPFGRDAITAAHGKHRIVGAMAEIISDRLDLPVITIGRIGGQFGKPRSRPVEVVDGVTLPAFRGLIVNGPEPTAEARRPSAQRLLAAHDTSRQVIDQLHWLAEPSTAFRGDYGRTRRLYRRWVRGGLWTSHEALILDYETPLVRRDPVTGEQFLSSTHLPWIGERTRQVDGAHVALLAGVTNPIGCKVGPDTDPAELTRLCARLDPEREPGRLTLIARIGAGLVRDRLPALVSAVRAAGHPVIWLCDPMHGNTIRTPSGHKTRRLIDILGELRGFFGVLRELGEWPGGVHLEVAGEEVTECIGRGGPPTEAGLALAYRSLCDPRLNNTQATLLAKEVADLLTTTDDPEVLLANG